MTVSAKTGILLERRQTWGWRTYPLGFCHCFGDRRRHRGVVAVRGLSVRRHTRDKVHGPSPTDHFSSGHSPDCSTGKGDSSIPTDSNHSPRNSVSQCPRLSMTGRHLEHHFLVPSFVWPGQLQGAQVACCRLGWDGFWPPGLDCRRG